MSARARRRNQAPAGAPDWIVTFADLMSILVCFFVLLISFSIQDKQKLQVVAGSMRDAFGVQPVQRKAGVIERDGTPTRTEFRYLEEVDIEETSDKVGPLSGESRAGNVSTARDMRFSTAAATLRQAIDNLPDIAELSRHIMVQETPQGLSLQLVDQDGRSMFAENARTPTERVRQLLAGVAPAIRGMPNRIRIEGHTSAGAGPVDPGYGPWELSADRANAVRAILEESGVPRERFRAVSGRADTEPMFPDNPFLAANRRVTITLLHEPPPVPSGVLR